MGLERVTEEIRTRAEREAQAEVAKAQSEADAVLADARNQADELRAKRREEAEHAVAALRRRELAAAELDAKKLRLDAEKDVLARLRAAVLDALAATPVDKRAQHLKALLNRATVEQGKVFVSEKDVDAAKKAGITTAGTVPSVGGLVVESPDGSMREDLTYESLFDEVWGGSLPKVAETLFRKE